MKRLHNEDGMVLTVAILIMVAFVAIAAAVIQFAFVHYGSVRRDISAMNALNLAEAGADDFMLELNNSNTYQGTNPPTSNTCNLDGSHQVTLYNDSVKGKGTYETCAVTGTVGNEIIAYSEGRIYLPANSSTPYVTRRVKIVTHGTVGFNYALQAGTGPLYMFGNTGFSGQIFSNSIIYLQDKGVTVTGSTLSAAGTDSTNNNCSVEDYQGSGAKITTSTVNGGGALNNCGVTYVASTTHENQSLTPQPLPTIDESTIISGISQNYDCDQAGSGGTLQSANFDSNSTTYDPNCHVVLSHNKTYTINGDVHIRGDLTIDGNTLNVSNSFTGGRPVYVIVDGGITVEGNGTLVNVNASGNGVVFVAEGGSGTVKSDGTTYQTCGLPLPTSRSQLSAIKTCSTSAITVSGNSLNISGDFEAPNSSINYSAAGAIGKMAAQAIVMNGSGMTTFIDIGNIFTTGTANIWNVVYYQQVPG